jgi:hypothetical protein
VLRPPRGRPRRLSWGCAVLRGHRHACLGWTLVSPSPYDVHRPSGLQLTCLPDAEASGGPPWTSAPLQSASPGTHAVPPASRLVGQRFLSWTLFTLRHSPRPVDTLISDGSLHRCAATCEVWIPPSRLLPPALPTRKRRSVHGLFPSRSSPRRNRCPSRGPCPLAVARHPTPPPRGRRNPS